MPGKAYGAAGMRTPAVGPVRVLSKSLGIKEYTDFTTMQINVLSGFLYPQMSISALSQYSLFCPCCNYVCQCADRLSQTVSVQSQFVCLSYVKLVFLYTVLCVWGLQGDLIAF